jgi:hypothetical protein
MGLFSTTHEYHSHDNSTHISFPDTIKVHEHKAPTDESIKLMEEMHDKAIKNIISKVRIEDNIVNGQCWLIEQPWSLDELKVCFKFKINGHEFNVEKFVQRDSFYDRETNRYISDMTDRLDSYAKSIMLWYTLKMFTVVAYEQITQSKFPSELLEKL